MKVVQVTAIVERDIDGTYTVVIEVNGLSRRRAHEVAEMLEQPVVNALKSLGELRPISTEIGHA